MTGILHYLCNAISISAIVGNNDCLDVNSDYKYVAMFVTMAGG